MSRPTSNEGPNKVPSSQAAEHSREGSVPNHAVQEQEEMQAALQQSHGQKKLAINEGGRTNESGTSDNPPGAVHGLPQPALKGTWR